MKILRFCQIFPVSTWLEKDEGRKTKNEMKSIQMHVTDERFFALFRKYDGPKKNEIKMKKAIFFALFLFQSSLFVDMVSNKVEVIGRNGSLFQPTQLTEVLELSKELLHENQVAFPVSNITSAEKTGRRNRSARSGEAQRVPAAARGCGDGRERH